MKAVSNLDLYKNKKNGDFLIQNYVIDERYGFSRGWGELLSIKRDEMHKNGPAIIIENLSGFEKRDSNDNSTAIKWSREKQKRIARENVLVGVRQESPFQIMLTPMKPDPDGGHVGSREDEVVIELPCSPEKFCRHLDIAFSKIE